MARKRGRKRRHIRLPLAEVISKVIDELVGTDGVLDYERAIKRAYDLLRESERRGLIEQALWQRLKQAMTRSKDSLRRASTIDFSSLFPGLFAAYALDADGERTIKRTASLTQLEFKRAIAIREKQIKDDRAALTAMERAYKAVEPIWNAHPQLTFGEICEIYQASRSAAE